MPRPPPRSARWKFARHWRSATTASEGRYRYRYGGTLHPRAPLSGEGRNQSQFARGALSRLPNYANDAEISESDRRASGQRRAVIDRALETGTQTRSRHLPLGNGNRRFFDRTPVDQMDAAGTGGHPREIVAADV